MGKHGQTSNSCSFFFRKGSLHTWPLHAAGAVKLRSAIHVTALSCIERALPNCSCRGGQSGVSSFLTETDRQTGPGQDQTGTGQKTGTGPDRDRTGQDRHIAHIDTIPYNTIPYHTIASHCIRLHYIHTCVQTCIMCGHNMYLHITQDIWNPQDNSHNSQSTSHTTQQTTQHHPCATRHMHTKQHTRQRTTHIHIHNTSKYVQNLTMRIYRT